MFLSANAHDDTEGCFREQDTNKDPLIWCWCLSRCFVTVVVGWEEKCWEGVTLGLVMNIASDIKIKCKIFIGLIGIVRRIEGWGCFVSASQDNEPWKQKQNGYPFMSSLRFDSLNRHTTLGIMHTLFRYSDICRLERGRTEKQMISYEYYQK